jgi:hypothetical protein
MSSLEISVNDALTDPTAPARAVQRAGGRVIGFVGADVPVELIVAADAFPLLLPAQAPGPTPRADAYLEPSFAPLERSIAEQWLRGSFDFLESVVFSRAHDSAQRLYYYLCELQRRKLCGGPQPLLYDLAKISRPSSADYTHGATQRLAQRLGTRTDTLSASIALRNRRRELLRQLQGRRRQTAAPSGALVERIGRAADCCDANQFDQALAQWLAVAQPEHVGPRLVLAGSAPADARLHEAVERAGGLVVAEVGDHALERLGAPIVCDGDPMAALSRHYHALPYGSRASTDRALELLGQVRATRAQAVIFWLLEEEEAAIWDFPAQQRQLREHGIPMLALTRCRWDTSDGALDSVRAFTLKHGAQS